MSPTPGAAGLAPKPGAAAPWESRDACWDGPGSGCAKGGDLVAPVAAPRGPRGPEPPPPTRLGVCRECTPDPVAAGSLGTVRALGCLREATRCPVGLCGPAVRLAEAWLLLQSVAGAFPYGGVIEYSLGPKG